MIYFSKLEDISADRQNVIKFFRCHEQIISFLRDAKYYFTLQGMRNSKVTRKFFKQMKKLFQFCYDFLTCFCYKNQENQNLLHKHLQLFTSNMQINVGQSRLICKMFENNRYLCQMVNQEILFIFEEVILKQGRRAEFIEFFKVVNLLWVFW